ncbi:MAG: helix-turn-helix domain-containing protein [Pseudolabrys sp.]
MKQTDKPRKETQKDAHKPSSKPADANDIDAGDEDRAGGSGMIQSVVMTGQIIEALAAAGQPMRLTALANQLGEAKAKMHRHLST